MEKWLPVVGYEGFYEVSDHGRVRSVDRVITRISRGKAVDVHYNSRELSPGSIPPYGYLFIVLSRGNRPSNALVHALVLEAFVGPCPAGMEARHLDGKPANNQLSNLLWDTHRANCDDRAIHGTSGRLDACPKCGGPREGVRLNPENGRKKGYYCIPCDFDSDLKRLLRSRGWLTPPIRDDVTGRWTAGVIA